MGIQTWAVARPGGDCRMATGEGAWRQLLTHDDVTKPAQIEALVMDGLRVELQPDETLVLVERNTLLCGPGEAPPQLTIVGIKRELDGTGTYLYLLPDRRLVFTSNFARRYS